MFTMLNVLVTGVGGPLGQAIIKAVRAASFDCRIIGTDRLPLSVGLKWVDRGEIIPDCALKDAYLAAIENLCREEEIQAVLPGSEGELVILAQYADDLANKTGAKVIGSPPDVLRIALDKFRTCQFLQNAGLRYPEYAKLSQAEDVEELIAEFGFPLIAKPCRGSGSQGLYLVRTPDDVKHLRTLAPDYVLQELLQPDNQEYTVAVFTGANGKQVGSICMRRELAAGNTYRAWVVENAQIQQEASAVVAAVGAVGPCNIQLRLTQRGPVTFEINPRFSGTTAMRAHFGYNEVEMSLRSFVFQEPVGPPNVQPGAALRYWDEVYVEPAA